MKLLIVLLVATAIYLIAMRNLIVEFRTKSTREERHQLQTVPMILSSTAFFLVFTTHTVELAQQGVLPLL